MIANTITITITIGRTAAAAATPCFSGATAASLICTPSPTSTRVCG
jgi:hypothetical protein